MPKYIFDVDGTLTPSRQRIDKEFAVWFSKFCEREDVYLVTGSDRPKTIEQVGEFIYHKCKQVYQCSGNDVYAGDRNVRTTTVDWHPHTLGFFQRELKRSPYPFRTGIHAEHRPGLINFSIVGRRASLSQRNDYVQWDKQTNERADIVDRFNKQFPQYQASVAGHIGIDIVNRGSSKAQIVPDFYRQPEVHFFGDMCDLGGNDYEISLAIGEIGGTVHHVKDWKDTWQILKQL